MDFISKYYQSLHGLPMTKLNYKFGDDLEGLNSLIRSFTLIIIPKYFKSLLVVIIPF